MKRIISILLSAIVLFFADLLFADTLWIDRNIYSSANNIKTGDVIVLKVIDLSRYKFDVKLRDNTVSDIESNPDVTVTGFLPKISQSKNFKNNTSTGFEGSSKIEFSMATQVTDVAGNGVLTLSGSRTYALNGVTTVVSVSGNVSSGLIKAGTVSSDKVANFNISIRSRKNGVTVRKRQIQGDETASAELTEQEKQRLVIDYIEKIIREMTR